MIDDFDGEFQSKRMDSVKSIGNKFEKLGEIINVILN